MTTTTKAANARAPTSCPAENIFHDLGADISRLGRLQQEHRRAVSTARSTTRSEGERRSARADRRADKPQPAATWSERASLVPPKARKICAGSPSIQPETTTLRAAVPIALYKAQPRPVTTSTYVAKVASSSGPPARHPGLLQLHRQLAEQNRLHDQVQVMACTACQAADRAHACSKADRALPCRPGLARRGQGTRGFWSRIPAWISRLTWGPSSPAGCHTGQVRRNKEDPMAEVSYAGSHGFDDVAGGLVSGQVLRTLTREHQPSSGEPFRS